MASKIADVKTWLEKEEHRRRLSEDGINESPEGDIPAIDVMLGASATLSQGELVSFLPPRADVDRFVAAWFNAEDPTRGMPNRP